MPAADRQPTFYVTAPLLWPLFLGLRVLGLDVESLASRAELSLEELRDPDARVPMERALLLMRFAAEAWGDTDLGLRLSYLYEPGAFGVLDHLARSSRTLREALEVLCRYERIHQNGMITSVREEAGQTIIDHRLLHPFAFPREVSDNTLANLIVIGRKWTGTDFTPTEVRIAHPEPAREDAYAQLFRCPIRWGAPSDAVILPTPVMHLPLLMPDTGLSQVLDRYVQQLLSKHSTPRSLGDRVRECICALLPRGDASLERVAQELVMGPRTLQRRLREERTSHGVLLEQLRRELCEQYLQQPQLSVEDVGLMLGFSDSRSFRRAFKRWTGLTPSEVRSEARSASRVSDGAPGRENDRSRTD